MKPAFRGATAHVRVPATSANLGPGFDSLGLALALCDDVMARVADDGLVVDVAGDGADLPRDESHLVVRAMRAAFERLGGQPHGLELSCANRIPHGRGLGSSAAAIVAGVLLARALVLGGEQRLPDADVLALASQIEGHPDNVAACLLGGLTVAWRDEQPRALRLEPARWLRPVALVPPQANSTHVTRGMLPECVPHADAATNAGRAALLVAALTGAPDALLAATQDRLHQGYRATAMPDSAALVDRLRADGIAAVLSGAGPTVLALGRDEAEAAAVLGRAPHGWQAHPLDIERGGARLVPARQ